MKKFLLTLLIIIALFSVATQFEHMESLEEEDVDGLFDSLKSKAKELIDKNKDKVKDLILEQAKKQAMNLAKSQGIIFN
jgi:thioredoxin-related protein